MEGYIKLHRKILDSAAWQNLDLARLWILCLLLANHKEKWVPVHGILEPIRVLPGQFITGRFELHKAYYPKPVSDMATPYTVWRWLETLQVMQNLSIKTSNRFSLISISNWKKYQINVQQNEQPMSSQRAADEQPVSTTKNVKNEENVKKKPSSDPRVGALITHFFEKLKATAGPEAKCNGGHVGVVMKGRLKQTDEKEIKKRIDNWFASTDSFVRQNLNLPGVFDSRFHLLKDGPMMNGKTQQPARKPIPTITADSV